MESSHYIKSNLMKCVVLLDASVLMYFGTPVLKRFISYYLRLMVLEKEIRP